MKISILGLICLMALLCSFEQTTNLRDHKIIVGDSVRYAEEKHLANMRQLTFGGDNAEAYWSFDGNKLIFQPIDSQLFRFIL